MVEDMIVSSKPTIAQVLSTRSFAGAERLAYDLASALHGAGYHSVCVATESAGPCASGPGLPPVFELGTRGGALPGLLKAARRLRRLIRDEGIDILHVHGENILLFCLTGVATMRRRPKLWFTWHVPEDVLGCSKWRRVVLAWALKRCEVVFGASRDIVQKLGIALGSRARLRVFRNFVPDWGEPTYEAHHQDVPEVIWQSRIVPKKNPEGLVKAVAALKSKGLKFHVTMAGDSLSGGHDYVAGIRRLVSQLGVEDMISMIGWVDDVPALLRRCTIGVQCSYTEGLSMSLLEQMMAGLAVVATDVGDTELAVRNGETGLLIPAGDQDALPAALGRLIQDRGLRTRLGCAARQQALDRFGPSAAVKQVAEALSGRTVHDGG